LLARRGGRPRRGFEPFGALVAGRPDLGLELLGPRSRRALVAERFSQSPLKFRPCRVAGRSPIPLRIALGLGRLELLPQTLQRAAVLLNLGALVLGQAVAFGSQFIGHAARRLEIMAELFDLQTRSLASLLGFEPAGVELRAAPAVGVPLLPRAWQLFRMILPLRRALLPLVVERRLELADPGRQLPVETIALGRECIGAAAHFVVLGMELFGAKAMGIAIVLGLEPRGLE
jgi:hypothetical protein